MSAESFLVTLAAKILQALCIRPKAETPVAQFPLCHICHFPLQVREDESPHKVCGFRVCCRCYVQLSEIKKQNQAEEGDVEYDKAVLQWVISHQ